MESSLINYSQTAGPDIPCLLWNPKVHYHVQKSQLLDSFQSQLSQIHTLHPTYFKILFNIILPPMPRFSKWSLPFSFPNQILYTCIKEVLKEICKGGDVTEICKQAWKV
jgi:hypothetical protein